MQVSDYKAAFSLTHLVFLEIDTCYCHLDFKILGENNKYLRYQGCQYYLKHEAHRPYSM